MIDTKELREKITTKGLDVVADTDILAVLDRLEAAEKERDEFKRACFGHISDNSMLRATIEAMEKERTIDEQRIADLMANLNRVGHENDALRAKIESMEQQEPHSYIYEYANPIDGSPVWRDVPGYWNAQYPRSSKPLYALPGAQSGATDEAHNE